MNTLNKLHIAAGAACAILLVACAANPEAHASGQHARYRPDVMVLNACYGRLVGYEGSFIMGKEDLYRAYQALPGATVVASHMEALAHCTQTRQELRGYIAERGMSPQRVLVPADGESYRF